MINKRNIIYLKNRSEGVHCQMSVDEQRASVRMDCEAPVIIEDYKTGESYDGSIYNYSRRGMYVELDYPLTPGSEIRIVIEESKKPYRPEGCHAKVIWCEEIPGAVVLYNYGIGVQCDLTKKPLKMTEKFKVIEGGMCKDDPL